MNDAVQAIKGNPCIVDDLTVSLTDHSLVVSTEFPLDPLPLQTLDTNEARHVNSDGFRRPFPLLSDKLMQNGALLEEVDDSVLQFQVLDRSMWIPVVEVAPGTEHVEEQIDDHSVLVLLAILAVQDVILLHIWVEIAALGKYQGQSARSGRLDLDWRLTRS